MSNLLSENNMLFFKINMWLFLLYSCFTIETIFEIHFLLDFEGKQCKQMIKIHIQIDE